MARDDAHASSLRRRPSRTAPAAVAATLVTAAGVAGVWAAVERLATGRWPSWVGATHKWAGTHTWGSAVVVTLAVVIAVVGLVLLVTALRPGMANAYEIDPTTGADPSAPGEPDERVTEYVMTRRSVARLASAHASLVPGVESVSASATTRRVTLTVKTASAQAEDIDEMVTSRVREALAGAGLSPQPTVSTTVRTTQP
ncbi:MAG: DUF6286 domain-containing protein [Terracoccus sp.]